MFTAFLATCLPVALKCRNKVNIKHPRPVHKERRVLDAVTQPIYQIPRGSLEQCLNFDSTNSVIEEQRLDQVSGSFTHIR